MRDLPPGAANSRDWFMPEGFTALRTHQESYIQEISKSAVIGIELSQSLDCDRHTESQRLVEIVSLQEQLTQKKENLGGGEKCEALHYVKARRWSEKRTGEGFKRGIEYLTRAIQIDPNYALAHTQLAECVSFPFYYGSVDPNQAYPKARASALRALEIDPDLAEGHAVLATVLKNYDWNWTAAEKEYMHAIQLNPNCTTAHYHYSYLLAEAGRVEEAIHEATEALSHDPMSPMLNAGLAFVLLLTRNYERCIHQSLTAIEVDPSMILSYFSLGNAYEQKGQYTAAIEAYEKGIALGGPAAFFKAFIGHVQGESGERTAAVNTLQVLSELSPQNYVPLWYTAVVFEGMGEEEAAIEALENAYQTRETMLVFLRVCPQFDRIRDNPRFQDIERLVGLRA